MMTVDEALAVVLRDVSFYGSQGGLTISGGEPMAQPDFTLELLRKASESGLTTCVETCGYFPSLFLPELCKWSDWLLWDVKDTDDARHKKIPAAPTGLSLKTCTRPPSCFLVKL